MRNRSRGCAKVGLDGVELVLECETRFGVSIADSEAAACLTVGDLQDLVVRKLGMPFADGCLTSHVFYRVRRVLRQQPEASAIPIRPSTSLADLYPKRYYLEHWDRLGVAAGLTFPQLELPAWYGPTVLAAAISSLVTVLMAAAGAITWPAALSLLGVAFALMSPLVRNSDRLRSEIPPAWSSVGGLARQAASVNAAALARERFGHEAEIRKMVADVVGEVLGVGGGRVTPDARFVADLGMD